MAELPWHELCTTIPHSGRLAQELGRRDKVFLVQGDLQQVFDAAQADLKSSQQEELLPWHPVFALAMEGVAWNGALSLAIRWAVGRWTYGCWQTSTGLLSDISLKEFLANKENALAQRPTADIWAPTVDFAPFDQRFPRLKDRKSIGRGGEFLNRHMANRLFADCGVDFRNLFEYLWKLQYQSQQLMLFEEAPPIASLRQNLEKARSWLGEQSAELPWQDFRESMARLGFAPGWGDNAGSVLRSMNLLSELLEAPDPAIMEEFVADLPGIFDIVILSPHGYFGQSGVLGLPDTGGQVVYILDQVRALETELTRRLASKGIDVQPRILVLTRLIPDAADVGCAVAREPIQGTRNSFIMRIPFREADGALVPQWISRFHVWPYLRHFAVEAEEQLRQALQRTPDLVIGNYSDGNYVASLLADAMGIVQCNIAHALEKSKYLFSDLFWQKNEEQYRFSIQFTADLFAMNRADFLVSSTYQEIAGGPDSMGQYESYNGFTLPGLYRVHQGIDVFDPKFNIISPGSDPDCYFSYAESERRLGNRREEIESLVFAPGHEGTRGQWSQPDRPVIFSMARMDKIKNLPALVEWYGASQELRSRANLLIVSGYVDASLSKDREEREMIEQMHALMDHYELDGCVRWSTQLADKYFNGELYRWVADQRGIFVQPALFEAFGLTVIEAMTSGVPTFATRYGGPLEIIQHGISGFHIDPMQGEAVAQQLCDFLMRCAENPLYWEEISVGGMRRVETHYTWKLYARRMLNLAQVYGFWRHMTARDRQESRAYLDLFHKLLLRQL